MKDLSTGSDVKTPSGVNPASQIALHPGPLRRFFTLGTVACLFILLGVALIPYIGIEDDEVIFANPLYLPTAKGFGIGLFHHQITLMVMSYLGTLKTLLYLPILVTFGANVWSLRLPMVLLGALTICMFYGLAKRSVGIAAAIVGSFLLASDPSFVFLNTVDWGPVAIEHFLLVTGCFFLIKFAQDGSRRSLKLGFFVLGLALWNKAIFIWALAGLSVGAIVVFWPEIRRLMRPATVAIAVSAFVIGALPLVVYNIRSPNATVSNSAHFETDKFAGKFSMLRGTLDGSALFGFLFGLEDLPNPKEPASLHGRLATWIGAHTGQRRRSVMIYACAFALLLIPWWWQYRTARFSLVFMCVAWVAMAVTRDAGGSAHHSVLLWPFPQLFLATALAALPWRAIMSLAGAVLVASNLLVVNQAVADLERNGVPPANFSNASFGLARAIAGFPAPVVFTLDWGIVDMLAFTQQGRLNLHLGDPPFMTDSPTPDQQKEIDWILSDRDAIFVTHVVGCENSPEVRPHLDRAAAEYGLHRDILKIVPDSNGRLVFEISRFVQ